MAGWGRRTLATAAVVAVVATMAPARARPSARSGRSWAGSQGCVDRVPRDGRVAWNKLRNPILSYPSSAVRDIGVRLGHGAWHVLFTSDVGNAPQWRIAEATTSDFASWSSPTVWPTQFGTAGLASPDVTRRPDGVYVVTYESNPDEVTPAGQDKIYYRTSIDLTHWSAPRRLVPTIHPAPADRLIDPALAWTHEGLYLGYKYGLRGGAQHFEIAWSASGSLDGPWQEVGRPNISVYGDTIENYEFLDIDGVWNVLGTSNNLDRPWLFSMTGDPDRPDGWLQWSSGRELEVPAESWNRAIGVPSVNFEQENAAYLCDARRLDGYFYLFYVGSNELTTFGGWGHTKLGVARSTNLVTWDVPCGPLAVSTPVGCEPG